MKKNKIKYKQQKTFKECKNVQVLQFDFYLPDYNCCIEYDGIQHFKPINFFGGDDFLKYIKQNDTIKNEYCKNTHIKLLRIKYDENINEKLTNYLFKSLLI